jgi:carbon starvation protein CstA
MARKKGGLGQAAPVEQPEDLLDSVFGAANQLLAALGLLAVATWRAKARKTAWASIFSSTATLPKP